MCTSARASIPRIKTNLNVCVAVVSRCSIGTPSLSQLEAFNAVFDDADDTAPRFIVNVSKGVTHDAYLVAMVGHLFGRRLNLRAQMRHKVIIDGGRLGYTGWDNLILCNCCLNSSVEFFRRDWFGFTNDLYFPDISTGFTIVGANGSENRR
jgi:hypothetical protein